MCRFINEVFKTFIQVTIVNLRREKMTGENSEKLFLQGSLSIQYIEYNKIQLRKGTHEKLSNWKNVAYDVSFLTINMKCLCNASL